MNVAYGLSYGAARTGVGTSVGTSAGTSAGTAGGRRVRTGKETETEADDGYDEYDNDDDDNDDDGIDHVDFAMMGPDEVRRRSVAEVKNFRLYERTLPKLEGPNDPAMGPGADRRIACATCGNKVDRCPGHMAHVEMPFPMYHAWLFPTTTKVLRCVCFWCCRLLLADADPRLRRIIDTTTAKQRLQHIFAQTKVKRSCVRCGLPQPIYKRGSLEIKLDWSNYYKAKKAAESAKGKSKSRTRFKDVGPHIIKRMNQPFTAAGALQILSAVPDIDYARMGIDARASHPSFQIIQAMAVGPPTIRPSISSVEGSRARGQDDLTCSYADVLAQKRTFDKTREKVRKLRKDDDDTDHDIGLPAPRALQNQQTIPSDAAAAAAAAVADARKEKLLSEVVAVDKDVYPRINLSQKFTEEETRMLVEATEADLDDVPKRHLTELQASISVLQSNSVKGVNKGRQRSGKNRKSLQQRFKGKGGRWRLTIGGKRVDYSTRTVIGPDPNIPMDTVVVPEKMSNALTKPKRVTDFNIKDLTERVRRGPHVNGGALQVVRGNGSVIYLDMVDPKSVDLRIGDVVHRHLIEGDMVIFNRQPSLHKLSTMAFKVKPMPGNTIRFNWVVTTPFNADFDGDEMNLHVVQDDMADAELREIMYVAKLAVDPAKNKTSYGPIQDAVLGSWLLTHGDVFFNREEVMQFMMQRTFATAKGEGEKNAYALPPPAIWKPKPLWTGKQVFSILLPSKIHMDKTIGDVPSDVMDGHHHVVIRRGELLSGTVDKSIVGIAHGSLNQVIWRDCGEDAVVAFNSDLVRVIDYHNKKRGFSVSYKDCIVSAETKGRMRERIDDIKSRMTQMMDPDVASHVPHHVLESTLQTIANKSLTIVGGEVKKTVNVRDNSVMQMVRSGAKGNEINPVNICALVGQQNANGKRIAVSSVHKLPRFAPCSKSPESHAFIEHPYATGLPPDQFFYHCICGCDGLVDTACNTATTGYLQRRLQKAMECIQVAADGTLRKISDGEIISLSYGMDGCDAAKMEKFFMPELETPSQCVALVVPADKVAAACGAFSNLAQEAAAMEMRHVRSEGVHFRKLVDEYVQQNTNILTPKMSGEVHIPVPVKRLIETHVPVQRANDALLPSELCAVRRKLNKDIRGVARKHDKLTLVQLLIAKYFSSAWMIVERRATRAHMETLAAAFLREYSRARIPHGEMVGSLASDSLGAPATQMTLNTFHYAGVASTSVHITQGVPRLNEILAASKRVNTPSMKLALHAPFCLSEAGAKIAQRFLEHVVLDGVVSGVDFPSLIEFQSSMNVAPFQPIVMEKNASTIVIRLKLAVDLLIAKTLGPADVKRAVSRYLNGAGVTYASDYGERQWYIGIRLKDVQRMAARVPTHAAQIEQSICRRFLHYCLPQCYIAGVPKVKKAIPICDDGVWFLQTQGSALNEMKFIPFIDFARSYSNHVYEVGEVMGLDVAAQVLDKELQTVLMSDGQYVNHRHIRVLVDTITHFGWLMPVNRHGINRVEKSVFSKANFEEQIDVLNDATLFGHTDRITGVTETNTVGATGKFGTGSVEVLYDRAADLRMQREMQPARTHHAHAHAHAHAHDHSYRARRHHHSRDRGCASGCGDGGGGNFGYEEEEFDKPSDAAAAADAMEDFLLDFARDEELRVSHPHPHLDLKRTNSDDAYHSDASPSRKRRKVTFADEADASYRPMSPSGVYSPTTHAYEPCSPAYEPSSPMYEPSSPAYEPSSPAYEPSSPAYDPTSNYEPCSPMYDPAANYKPCSPAYDPTTAYTMSPMYSLKSPVASPPPLDLSADRPYSPPDDMDAFHSIAIEPVGARSVMRGGGGGRSGDDADEALRHQRPYSPSMDDPEFCGAPSSSTSAAVSATATANGANAAASHHHAHHAHSAHPKAEKPKADKLPFGYDRK